MKELKGIDVSAWQGQIDWDAVKADGIDFAILRCGYGIDLADQDDEWFEMLWNAREWACLMVCIYLAMPTQ